MRETACTTGSKLSCVCKVAFNEEANLYLIALFYLA